MPTPVAPFNKYVKHGAYHYNATLGTKSIRDFDIRLSARYETAVRLLGPTSGDRVLDAGSGEGVASILCCRRGASVVALEMEAEACQLGQEIARQEGFSDDSLRFMQHDLYKLPYPDKTFDGIISLEVIEHMSDVHAYLRELRRVLKLGGKIVISTPHKRMDGILQDEYHVTEFDGPELARTLAEFFHNVQILSGWSVRLQGFYEKNWPSVLLGKTKRSLFRFAALRGFNLFAGGCVYSPKCPLIYSVGRADIKK